MAVKKSVNLSVDAEVLDKARGEGLNLSAEFEQTMRRKVSSLAAERWARENASVIAEWNKDSEENGLWSDGLRQF